MPAATNPSFFAQACDHAGEAVWGAPWAASLLFCTVCLGTVGHEPPEAWENSTGSEKDQPGALPSAGQKPGSVTLSP